MSTFRKLKRSMARHIAEKNGIKPNRHYTQKKDSNAKGKSGIAIISKSLKKGF